MMFPAMLATTGTNGVAKLNKCMKNPMIRNACDVWHCGWTRWCTSAHAQVIREKVREVWQNK
jgi:hypothetical protein